jgi:hypothetical protein
VIGHKQPPWAVRFGTTESALLKRTDCMSTAGRLRSVWPSAPHQPRVVDRDRDNIRATRGAEPDTAAVWGIVL